jgi:hypothetical protein
MIGASMAESSLSIGLPELRQEVGFYLGYGRGVNTAWTASQLTEIDGYIQSGVRRVYYPPASPMIVNGKATLTSGYEWSWLHPTSTLTLETPYATGTVTIAAGVVTLVGGVWPTWAADAQLTVGGQIYTVATRTSDTAVVLTDVTVTVSTASTYTIIHSYIYDLPDDFGGISGGFEYPSVSYLTRIQIVAVSDILERRAFRNDPGAPKVAAIRYKPSTQATGSRQEVLFFPIPDSGYVLSYEYEAYSGSLTNARPYALGGMQMAEVYIESCLAVVEARKNDTANGPHFNAFGLLLQDAIARDRKKGAQLYGQMGSSREGGTSCRCRRNGSAYPIYYQGEIV